MSAFFVLGAKPKTLTPANTPAAFFGPAIRGFFRIVGKGLDAAAVRVLTFSDRFFDQNTRLGRTFVKLFGPFSLPVQTTKTVAEDIIAEIVQGAVIDQATKEILIPFLLDHKDDVFNLFFQRNADGSIELGVTPGWFTDP